MSPCYFHFHFPSFLDFQIIVPRVENIIRLSVVAPWYYRFSIIFQLTFFTYGFFLSTTNDFRVFLFHFHRKMRVLYLK